MKKTIRLSRGVVSRPVSGLIYAGLTAFLALFLCFSGLSQAAETMKLLGSGCAYVPTMNRDSCWSTYEYCTNGTVPKTADVTLKYALPGDKAYSDSLKDVSALKSVEASKAGCAKIYVTGLKMPTIAVDNIPCVGEKCYPEYVWWNQSFLYKKKVSGNLSTMSENVTQYIYLNMSLNGSTEKFFCNFTVPTANATLGYVYYNNQYDYICVNSLETAAVLTDINDGNSTDYLDKEVNLVGWYHMNTGLIGTAAPIVDKSIYKQNCTTTGTVIFNAGNVGKDILYDATYLHNCTDKNQLEGATAFTIIMWYKPADLTGTRFLFAKWAPGYLLYALYTSGTTLTFEGGGKDATATIGLMSWQHIVVTMNSTSWLNLYINGTWKDNSAGVATALGTGSTALIIAGADYANSANGYIDDVRFYNRTLSDNEIKAIYAAESNGYFSPGTTEERGIYIITPSFVPPTDNNTVTVHAYSYFNVTTDAAASSCWLQLNVTNYTMDNVSSSEWFVNVTALTNGNYTFLGFCNNSVNNVSSTGPYWVYINFSVVPFENPYGVILQCDLCAPLPIKTQYCLGNSLVTFRERVSCVGGWCMAPNQTDITLCANGCADNITALGSDCAPPMLNIVVEAFAIVIIFLMLAFYFTTKRRKRR